MEDLLADVLGGEEIRVIESHMMNYRKFMPLLIGGNFVIRGALYPFNLVKTRLQAQTGNHVYKGTFHAFANIWKYEGIRGLYSGVGINIPQIVPSLFYIMTYEQVRHYMNNYTSVHDNLAKSFIGGGVASVVGQSMSVPLDIITQHIMLVGRAKPTSTSTSAQTSSKKVISLEEIHIPDEERAKRFGTVKSVVSHLYERHGVLGFYKGYFVSLLFFVPNSALWWTFYEFYKESLFKSNILPDSFPRLFLYSCISGPMSGMTTAIITNPVDVLRVRIQVKHSTLREAVRLLREEEGKAWFLKGLSARLLHTLLFSICVIPFYESIKKASLLDEYKDQIR